jgi:hypothetical protein
MATAPLCEVPAIVVGNPVYSDNCPNPQLTWSKTGATVGSGVGLVNNTVFHVGLTVVTYTITDASGNSESCSFTVRVNDQVPPTIITCPPATINASTDAGQCFATLTIAAPQVVDPCGEIVSVTNNYNGTGNASGVYPVGTTVVIWTITDESLNSVTCTQAITVTDSQVPTITCPANVTALATAPLCEVPAIVVGNPVYSDNCPNPQLTWIKTGATLGSGVGLVNNTVFHVGLTVVTYTITDASSNSESCSFTVRVNDQVPPTIINCPANVSQNAPADSCQATVNVPMPVVSDPCQEIVATTHNSPYGITSSNASGTYPVGNYTIGWVFTDESGNQVFCTQTVSILDITLPTLTCPADFVVQADFELLYGTNIPIPPPTYYDACGVQKLSWIMTGATTGASPLTGINIITVQTLNVGITQFNYTATDPSGNVATCSFTVTVLSEPEIECPANISVNTDNDHCSALVASGLPTLISGAEPIVWTWQMSGATVSAGIGRPITPNPYPFNTGTTSIMWMASNISGTDTCYQTITVADTQPPTFIPPNPMSFCVENIYTAQYYDPAMDIMPDRPEFHLLPSGSTVLNLDTAGFSDNCPLTCAVEIHWWINFSNGAVLPALPLNYIIGQPSLYPSDIELPGSITGNLTHTITYQIVDCNGNVSFPVAVSLLVTPRPNVIKQ